MSFSLRKYLKFRYLALLFLATSVVVTVGVGLYALYLDGKVRDQFEGRRFALPARVYARPLELFVGVPLSAEEFAKELQRLGYQQPLRSSEPGYYLRHDNEFEVVTRPFVFWDGAQPSLTLHLSFGAAGLEALTNSADGTPVTLTRLDPEYIGGIYPAHNEDRVLVKLDEVPADLVNGLIAVEDRKFYTHAGVDPRGIVRALVSTLSGGPRQGGSTLTQQLVKNFFLTPERTLKRKFNEALMALLLDYHYEKNEILETYINEIYLGQDKNRAIHGFGLAAQFYFGKPLKELSLAQSAMLVGIVKGPKVYDPHKHPERTKERRNLALSLMRDQKFITEEQFLKAKIEPLGVIAKTAMGTTRYPAFFDLVRKQLLRDYQEADLRSEGLQIFTTLDPRTQAAAENALVTRLTQDKSVAKDGALLEGAVVVTDSQNGEIQAMVGGRDPSYPGFNRALDSRRSIGSLMKPAVYLAALSEPSRYTLITPMDDSPLTWREPGRPAWSPKNYDKANHGEVALRTALANSYNIPTARIGLDLGVEKVVATASSLLGTEEPIPPYASSVLGAVPLSPLEVTQMYQTIASGGFRVPLRAIREVLTADGIPLQRYPLSVEQVADAESIYLLTTAMQGVVREGTAKGLVKYVPAEINVAGKTGTTDDSRDAWFAGFTGDRVAVVWVGYDDNRPTRFTGGSGAMPIWGQLMAQLNPEPLEPPLPDNVEKIWIDAATGSRGDLACPEAVELPFIKGSAPTEVSPCVAEVMPVESLFPGL
ncbi:MAG TPA: penicillin-binding protein 1B [Gammaproteobacteria bacterium]